MTCKHCTDEDGVSWSPMYGVGPHRHEGDPHFSFTIEIPKEYWPSNYKEAPDCPGLGIWWCKHCEEGKPS